MKTIIAGSRDISNQDIINNAVKESRINITEVVCGGARGVDTLGAIWGKAKGSTSGDVFS